VKTLLLLLACIVRYELPVVADKFEYIEVNTIRSTDSGKVRLKQYIWWDDDHGARIAQGWLLYERVGRMPRRVDKHYELAWFDGQVFRRVSCRAVLVTETLDDDDPEVKNRKLVPLTHRRGLSLP